MALVPLTVAIPLLAAGALAAVKPLSPRRSAQIASIAAAAAVAAVSGVLLARAGGETLVYWFGGWEPRGHVAVGISFLVDPVSAGLVCFAAVLTVAALVFALRYVDVADDLFYVLMLVFLAGMTGFSLAGDLFTAFVFFELMGISAYALAGYNVEQRAPIEGSLNFAVTNTAGSFLLLFGIGLLYGRAGALNLAQLGEALAPESADGLVIVAFVLIAAGFLVKAAAVPFHFWLADAYAVARTPVCILLAAVMSELGLYGLARVYWAVFSGSLGPSHEELRIVLVALGVLTALVGAAMTLLQGHLKRLLAFATMAYVGLMLVGVGLLEAEALAGAAVFVVGDGFLKAALFVCVGIVQHRTGDVDEADLHGAGRPMRWTGLVLVVATAAVCSLPPFGAFLGKSMIEHGASAVDYGWLVALYVAVPALVGAALLRAAARVFLGVGTRAPGGRDPGAEPEEPESEPESRTPVSMFATAVALLACGLAIGLWPGLSGDAVAAAHRFIDRAGYAAVGLGGAGATDVREGHFSSYTPAAHDYLLAALTMAGAAGLAWLSLFRDPRRLPGGRVLQRPLHTLRRLHSGHVGDYLAWLAAGTAVFGGCCALALGT